MGNAVIGITIQGVGTIPGKSKQFTGNVIETPVDLTVEDSSTVEFDVTDDDNDDILAVVLYTNTPVSVVEHGATEVSALSEAIVLFGEDCKKIFPSSPAVGLDFVNSSGVTARIRGVIIRAVDIA